MRLIRFLRWAFFIAGKFSWRAGIYRTQYHFKLKFWNKKKRPLCWIIGHKPYESHDWGGGNLMCSRCYKRLKVLWRPTIISRTEKEK